ncbi:MAG: hypothetical protein U0R70_02235 [Solirubrobacteraceae bacterium]
MRVRLPIACATAAVALLATASPSLGAGRRWSKITADTNSNIQQVGLARTDDRVLKVAWLRERPGDTRDLVVTTLQRDGRAGASVTVLSGWKQLGYPALVRTGGRSLLAVFGGIRTLTAGDPADGLLTASTPDGTAWTLGPALDTTSPAAGASPGAVLGPPPARTLYAAFASGSAWVYAGLTPGAGLSTFTGAGCCYYNGNVAVDGKTGQVVLAYDSNVTGDPGRHVQPVDAAGRPAGAPIRPPGAAVRFDGRLEAQFGASARAPITGRPGKAGIFTAYDSGYVKTNRILVWRLGARRAVTLARRPDNTFALASVGIAAAPSGRLWVFWAERASTPSGYVVVARRSNRAATRFGPRIVKPPPPGTSGIYAAAGNAQTGPLDLLLTVGRVNAVATWHRQFITGVSLFPTPRRARPGQKVTFLVTDAGDPVRRARVRFGTRSARTNAKGKVTLPAPAATAIATVTASGYGAARAKVTITR